MSNACTVTIFVPWRLLNCMDLVYKCSEVPSQSFANQSLMLHFPIEFGEVAMVHCGIECK